MIILYRRDINENLDRRKEHSLLVEVLKCVVTITQNEILLQLIKESEWNCAIGTSILSLCAAY